MAFTPVIIGVADVKNKSQVHKEPATLMFEAISNAIHDTGLASLAPVTSQIDSIDVVRTWTWPYADLPGLLGKWLGLDERPAWTRYTDHGGNEPAKLVDEAAGRIARGESKVAVVTGGEALASDIGGIHSIGTPIQIYPLYENAFRARRGQKPKENNGESAALYADFAQVAATNQYSWNHGNTPATKEEIGVVSKRNRMICSPYPLLMNAFNTVNLAAAVLLTSAENARELGVPEDKWVYPLGGAGRKERKHFWERPSFHHSDAISIALDECLSLSGVTMTDIDVLDLYSPKPLTLLGGLTSFGGAGNNYSMHAITEMSRQLRSRKAKRGLVLANGGFLSYQHALCLSSEPRREGSPYPDSRGSSAAVVGTPAPVEPFAQGEAVVETYTVQFDREGNPEMAFIIGRLTGTNYRFVANHRDQRTLQELASAVEEQIGKVGYVDTKRDGNGDPESNTFFLGPRPRI
ncbi:hypothetical protein SLS64_006045 [Diaporthe eres]